MLREFGGLELNWQDGARPRRYDVESSSDGATWQVLRRVTAGDGVKDALLLPDEEARFIRINLHEAAKDGYALAELAIKDVTFGASPNAFFQALAKDAPRGLYPRGFSGEQAYWTLVGVDGGAESALLSEDGAVEIGRGGFSIEPYIMSGSRLITWADVKATQSLADGYLPVPSVTWQHPEWSMQVTAFAHGTRDAPELVARYTVTNTTDKPQSLQLVLAARPFQVNPPTQFLNITGGVSAIRSLDWDGAKLSVNGQAKLVPLAAPDRFSASAFESGSYPDKLRVAAEEKVTGVADDTGFASAALIYKLELAPRESRTIGLVAPLARRGDTSRPCRPVGRSMDRRAAAAGRVRLARQAQPGRIRRSRRRSTPHQFAAVVPRAHPDDARRSCPAPGDALLRTLMDPRWGDDVGIARPAGPRRHRSGLSPLVRPAPVRQRQGALLRRLQGCRSRAGERQQRTAHLPRQ